MFTTSAQTLPPSSLNVSSESPAGLDSLVHSGREALAPEPRLAVSEWADEYRLLPPTSAEPGRWRTSRVPYLRDIMDALSSHHRAEFVTVMKGSQVGCTEGGNNWIGYCIHHAPGLMLIVYPGLSEVKRNTSTRIDPLIESTPAVRERVSKPRSRDAGNSMFRKKFPGGELVMTGANSAVGLRSTPARYLFLDEIDGYPLDADGEGDPVDLAERRTATFRSRRKIYKVSTPTLDGVSRIQKAYLESDQRRYFVPCQHCGEYEPIEWQQIQWPEAQPSKAMYVCQHCDGAHSEADKKVLLELGQWRATADGDGRHVGFHLPALLSPFEPWGELAEAFLRVKDDPSRLKVWVNTALGEVWREKGEAPEWRRLYERRETYRIGSVPQGGVLLTAGVDVQVNRLEAEVVAWDRNKRSWSVEYRVMMGDTSKLDDPVWAELTALLNDNWPHESGVQLVLSKLAIDDGYNSQIVREWARHHPASRVMVVRGREAATAPVGLPTSVDIDRAGRRIPRGMRLWPVGSSLLKSELYGWLRMDPPTDEELESGSDYPPGYCHFPEYDDEFFKMLTAERLIKRTSKGYVKLEWEKTRERSESLDCRIYARASAIALGVDRWSDSRWEEVESHLRDTEQGGEPINPGTVRRTTRRRPGRYTLRNPYMDR